MQGIAGGLAVDLGDPGGKPGRWAEAVAPADRRVEFGSRLAFGLRQAGCQTRQQIGIADGGAAYDQVLANWVIHGAALCRRRHGRASERLVPSRDNAVAIAPWQ